MSTEYLISFVEKEWILQLTLLHHTFAYLKLLQRSPLLKCARVWYALKSVESKIQKQLKSSITYRMTFSEV